MSGYLPPGCTQTECDQAQPGYWDDDRDPPQVIITCKACDGQGFTVHRVTVYEHGCGFPHNDSEERPCERCGGHGEFIEEAEGVTV